MSTLDQAFIRAYHKGADDASSRRRVELPAGATGPVRYQAVDVIPHEPVPPPHVTLPAAKPAAAAIAATHVAPAAIASGSVASAAASRVPAKLVGRKATLEPAFEVPHFVWPEIVDSLLAKAALPCAGCGAQLVGRSAEHRKVMLLTADKRGHGCSTAALVIARSVARRGLRVVLVDADLRHPHLAELLGVTSKVSWAGLLTTHQTIDEALIESSWERITLMPLTVDDDARQSPPNLAGALQALRNHFDLVIVDAGALEDDAAAIDLAAMMLDASIDDGVIVHAGSQAPQEVTRPVARRLTAAGVRRWELVENFV
ncbi:MAG TPA: division plane positioning ATPase MipZ [Pirellulales bacterium]|jgi:Mrp family chromosome partitioning ATPase|nr:division plane positioning ATPase MipZ [Pirellulales bacterium]